MWFCCFFVLFIIESCLFMDEQNPSLLAEDSSASNGSSVVQNPVLPAVAQDLSSSVAPPVALNVFKNIADYDADTLLKKTKSIETIKIKIF